MFHDFYYGKGPSPELIDRIRTKLRTCITNLFAAQSYREAVQAPFVEVRGVDEETRTFPIDGVPVYAQPDLLYRTGDGMYHVVDWKSGEEDEDLHPLQLRTYALYVRNRADLDTGPIRGRLEYLFKGTAETVPIDDADLVNEQRGVVDSVAMMRKYLVDSATNQPRGREAFPLRDDTSDCRYCKFFELCEEEIEGAVSGPF